MEEEGGGLVGSCDGVMVCVCVVGDAWRCFWSLEGYGCMDDFAEDFHFFSFVRF